MLVSVGSGSRDMMPKTTPHKDFGQKVSMDPSVSLLLRGSIVV
jgi:hypothetical protein